MYKFFNELACGSYELFQVFSQCETIADLYSLDILVAPCFSAAISPIVSLLHVSFAPFPSWNDY